MVILQSSLMTFNIWLLDVVWTLYWSNNLQLSKNKKEEQLCNYKLPKETDFVPESYFYTTFISNYIKSAS